MSEILRYEKWPSSMVSAIYLHGAGIGQKRKILKTLCNIQMSAVVRIFSKVKTCNVSFYKAIPEWTKTLHFLIEWKYFFHCTIENIHYFLYNTKNICIEFSELHTKQIHSLASPFFFSKYYLDKKKLQKNFLVKNYCRCSGSVDKILYQLISSSWPIHLIENWSTSCYPVPVSQLAN